MFPAFTDSKETGTGRRSELEGRSVSSGGVVEEGVVKVARVMCGANRGKERELRGGW